MSNEFEIGDVVTLKSGGPKMTVSSIDDTICQCVWFEQSNKMEDSFSHELLKKFVPSGGSFDVRRA